MISMWCVYVFLFKQKPAYEVRISDWSSDVCSSDLRMLTLGANGSRTLLYKLVADADDVKDSGIFTQDVTIEAQDSSFRSLGGTQLVLGINVLPSARIGLAGASTLNDGHAVVDLGALRPGVAQGPPRPRAASPGSSTLNVPPEKGRT